MLLSEIDWFKESLCPLVLTLSLELLRSDAILEKFCAVDSGMHKIAMTGRKQRVDDLFKIILNLRLPLLSIGPDSILKLSNYLPVSDQEAN